MQQAPPESAFQGSQAQGSGSSQLRRSDGDPPQSARAPVGRPKKRERNEAVSDSVKHQRTDKSHSCVDERDGSQKPEAPSLVGKDGGLCSVASVDRLVCIMTYEWNDSMQRPVDLTASRTMLANVVAATVELDCLFRFLKLGGLCVLDRWLQEVYISKPSTEKEVSVEGDRAAEDLLLALLGALERLPVDLIALKTCSIGKSVNYLRSHKHPDIQRRARKLVETWKKRVESEMKQSGEARFLMEQSVCPQQPEARTSTANAQQESHPEHPAPIEYAGVGRGKYASVASLCSSPESQSKASSIIMPPTCSVDTCNKSLLSPLKPSNEGPRPALESTLHPSNVFPQSSEDGGATSSACVPGPCNQIRAARNTGSSRHSKNTYLSISNTSSVATALSGSVFVPKDTVEHGFVFDRSARGANLSSAAEVCTLPCCSFFQKSSDNAMVYDPQSRSTLNSASSCVAGSKEKTLYPMKHSQPQMCSEPVKAGIQLLASIAASESSTVDVKSPDSPSVKSMCLQRATTLPVESKICAENVMKNHNFQPSKSGGSLQEREHYDRNSSTLSSPSEASTHMNTFMCENKRALAVYENTPSPADTASETSLPSAFVSKEVGRKRGACTSGLRKEHGKVQSTCEKSKRPCLQPSLVVEAVGESSIVDKVDCENRANCTPTTFFEDVAVKKASMERSPTSRCSEDGLEAARLVAVKVEQEAECCKGISFRKESFDRNSSPCGEAVVANGPTGTFALVGSIQESLRSASPLPNVPFSALNGNAKNSPVGAHAGSAGATIEQKQWNEAPASAIREENRRPEFDLNEMLSGCEEGPVQAPGPISKSLGPMQAFSLPDSDAIPALPIVPMAPIAVVAAAKGPFMLQSISCYRPPMGELGWKGSAATSAFRPTQPRTSLQKSNLNVPEETSHGKTVLDFDLNISADSSSFVDDKIGNADSGVKSSSGDVKAATLQASRGAIAGSVMPRKVCEAAWDLNLVDDGAAESGTKLDFDLNNGPIVQDSDDVVLAAKHIRMKDPLPSINSNRLPIHPITPILMPAFAMPNPDIPYTAGNAMPWVNGGSHDGLLQYNIFMQNPSGFASSAMACPPLPSLAAGPFQGIPFRFSSASMQGFSAPLGDTLGAPQSATVFPPLSSTEPLVPSQSKPPYIMGMLADVVHQQGMGGFWNRPNLDLNAGPDGVDVSNAKDDRRHMFVMNEQMRARAQVADMAAVLQQREQEACVGMPGSMQGVQLKQSVWR